METAPIRQHQKLLERTNWFQRIFPPSQKGQSLGDPAWECSGVISGLTLTLTHSDSIPALYLHSYLQLDKLLAAAGDLPHSETQTPSVCIYLRAIILLYSGINPRQKHKNQTLQPRIP